MKYWLACFLLTTSMAFGQTYEQAISDADSMGLRFARSLFNRAIVVGIYYQDQDTIVANGRINGLGRKADQDDVFQIGSVSKTITGLMFARSLEEGWITMDSPVGPHLTNLKEKHCSKYDTITFGQVVSHTSGLPNNTLDVIGPTFLVGNAIGFIKNRLILRPLHLPDIFIFTPWHAIFIPPLPHFTTYGPGSIKTDLKWAKLRKHGRYKYSNVGYGVIGNILAERHQANFEGLLQQEFARPLGLKATSTQPRNLPKGKYATPHDFFGIRTVRTQFAEGGMEGAGDIKMSARDLMTYMKLQFDKSHPWYPTVRQQHETLFESGDPKHPEVAAVGTGWLKDREPDGTEILWHHDHLLGTSAFIAIVPEKDLGIFLLANTAKDRKLTKLGFWWIRKHLEAQD